MATEIDDIEALETELAEIRVRQKARGVEPEYEMDDASKKASPLAGALISGLGDIASMPTGLTRWAGSALRYAGDIGSLGDISSVGPAIASKFLAGKTAALPATKLTTGLQSIGKAGSAKIEGLKSKSPSVRAYRERISDTGLFEELPLKVIGGIGPTATAFGLALTGPIGMTAATAGFLGLNSDAQIQELEASGVDPNKANGVVTVMPIVVSFMDRLGLKGINLPKLPVTNKLMSAVLGYAVATGSEGVTEPAQTLVARLSAERAANPDENIVKYTKRMFDAIPELSEGLGQEAVVAALTGGVIKFGADVGSKAKGFRTRKKESLVQPQAEPFKDVPETVSIDVGAITPDTEALPEEFLVEDEQSPITGGLRRLKQVEEGIAAEQTAKAGLRSQRERVAEQTRIREEEEEIRVLAELKAGREASATKRTSERAGQSPFELIEKQKAIAKTQAEENKVFEEHSYLSSLAREIEDVFSEKQQAAKDEEYRLFAEEQETAQLEGITREGEAAVEIATVDTAILAAIQKRREAQAAATAAAAAAAASAQAVTPQAAAQEEAAATAPVQGGLNLFKGTQLANAGSGKKGKSLSQFVRQGGGIKASKGSSYASEMKSYFNIKEGVTLVNNKTGVTLGRSLARAIEAGYVSPDTTLSKYFDILREDVDALTQTKSGKYFVGGEGAALPTDVDIDAPQTETSVADLNLEVGDTFTIKGQRHRVVGYDEDGAMRIEYAVEPRVKVTSPDMFGREKGERVAPDVSREADDEYGDAQEQTLSEAGGKVVSAAGRAISEAGKGAAKLFGVGPGTVASFPAGLDQAAYEKARPHLFSAFQATIQVGKSLNEFIRLAVYKLGRKMRPYIKYFIEENKDIFGDMPKTRRQQVQDKVAALKEKEKQVRADAKRGEIERIDALKAKFKEQQENAKAKLAEQKEKSEAKIEELKEDAKEDIAERKEVAAKKEKEYLADRKRFRSDITAYFNDKKASSFSIRTKILNHAKRYIPAGRLYGPPSKDGMPKRGGVIDAIVKAETNGDLLRAYVRIDVLAEKVIRDAAIQDIKDFGVRIKGRQNVTPGVKASIAKLTSKTSLDEREQAIKDLHSIKDQLGHEYARVMQILTRKSFDEMTSYELMVTRDALLFLEKKGAQYYKTFKELHAEKVSGIVDSIVGGMTALNSSNTSAVSIYGAPMNVTFDRFNGSTGSYSEPVFMEIKRPLDVDNGNYLHEKARVSKGILDLAERLKLGEKEYNRIGIYAAAQQEEAGGIRKLINTGYTKPEIAAVINSMTDEELTFYHYVRGVYESIFPRVQDAVRDIDGRIVKGEDFFSPFRTDYDKAKMNDPGDKIIDIIVGKGDVDLPANKAKDEFTKERTGPGKQPIRVDFMGLALEHVDNSLFLVHVGRRVKLNNDIIHHPKFQKAAGDLGGKYMSDWSDTVARNGGVKGSKIRILDTIRRNMGIGTLGGKLSTVAIQLSSIPFAVSAVGPINALNATFDISSSKEWRDFVDENMPEIEARFVDDIGYKEILEGKTTLNSEWLHKATIKSFVPLKKMDWFSAASVGLAAYNKYMKDRGLFVDINNPNQDAIQYAQVIVGRTQASMQVKDMPLFFSRGTGFNIDNRSLARFLGQFLNFTTNQWSYIRHDAIRSGLAKGNFVKTANIALWTTAALMASVVLRDAVSIALLFGDEPPEDEDSFWEKVFYEALSINPISSMVVSVVRHERFPVPGLAPAFKLYQGAKKAITAAQPETQLRGLVAAVEAIGQGLGVTASVQIGQLVKQHAIGSTVEQLQAEINTLDGKESKTVNDRLLRRELRKELTGKRVAMAKLRAEEEKEKLKEEREERKKKREARS